MLQLKLNTIQRKERKTEKKQNKTEQNRTEHNRTGQKTKKLKQKRLFSARKYIFGIYQMNIKCFVCLNKSIIYGLFFTFFFLFSSTNSTRRCRQSFIKILQKIKKYIWNILCEKSNVKRMEKRKARLNFNKSRQLCSVKIHHLFIFLVWKFKRITLH